MLQMGLLAQKLAQKLAREPVASLVGYVAKNQLARLFKSARGMTPRTWRKTQG